MVRVLCGLVEILGEPVVAQGLTAGFKHLSELVLGDWLEAFVEVRLRGIGAPALHFKFLSFLIAYSTTPRIQFLMLLLIPFFYFALKLK